MVASLPKAIRQETDDLISRLVELGLADDQNCTILREKGNDICEVTFGNAAIVSIALRDIEYNEIYEKMVEARSYNAKLLDGAVLQIMYEFKGRSLRRHRLAFFPSPQLVPFQADPELYKEDTFFSEIIARRIVPFPIRFDYDDREGIASEIIHPKSHLTLGQYEYCRIPVTSPLRPAWFVDFVIRNFYHTASHSHADQIGQPFQCFSESIFSAERTIIHIAVPR